MILVIYWNYLIYTNDLPIFLDSECSVELRVECIGFNMFFFKLFS